MGSRGDHAGAKSAERSGKFRLHILLETIGEHKLFHFYLETQLTTTRNCSHLGSVIFKCLQTQITITWTWNYNMTNIIA